jgi:hypothetical protein
VGAVKLINHRAFRVISHAASTHQVTGEGELFNVVGPNLFLLLRR